MFDITGKTNLDPLPVVIATAPGIEQLLGVSGLINCTELEMFAVYSNLQDRALFDKIQAFVVDTTALNAGRLNGECVLLEQKLDQNILLMAC